MFIVLHGADDFSAHEALAKLLNDPRFDYNVERFDGANADIGTIRAACETMPFLSDGRLVVVAGLPKPKREKASAEKEPATTTTEAEAPANTKATKGKRGTKKLTATALAKEFVDTLAQTGATLPATTTLAVLVEEELPKTHALIVAAQTHGKIATFALPTGAALDKWITQRTQLEGVTIAPAALRLLATFAVGQLRLLANEINKLATYVGPGGVIDAAAVTALVPDSREARVFDLADALARGERATALTLLHELLDDGQQPLMILGMVARQVRMLMQVKDLAARGVRGGDIAATVGMPPFIVEKTIAQSRRFSSAQIEAAQRACLTIDTALKRSRVAPDLALDLLIAEFGQELRV